MEEYNGVMKKSGSGGGKRNSRDVPDCIWRVVFGYVNVTVHRDDDAGNSGSRFRRDSVSRRTALGNSR